MRANADDVSPRPRLAFEGTVQAVDGTRATVRVDRLLTRPIAGLPAGRAVQVLLAPGESVSAGETAVFDVSGWELGESIVLHSIGHRPPSAPHRVARPRAVRARKPRADLVVRGTVRRIAQAPPPGRAPVTEHDPKWHEATVEVTGTVEGEAPGKEVTVRFPASNDVSWHRAPKLSLGQTGTFHLKRVVSGSGPPTFTAVDVRDQRAELLADTASASGASGRQSSKAVLDRKR